MGFEVTRQVEYFNGIKDSEKFHISDDLLFDCIGLGCGCNPATNRVQGFSSGKGFGYALLTYFASIALGFRRLPFCEDRIYKGYMYGSEDHAGVLRDLGPGRVSEIVDELKRLYDHTQMALNRAGLSRINVRREIQAVSTPWYSHISQEPGRGYAETLIMLKKSCDILGIDEVEIEMDTLNSFGDEGAYSSEVKIELTVPASDILYCSALIGDREGEQKTMESGEWVVINSSPTGVVRLPVSSITYDKSMWKMLNQLTESKAKSFINCYEPIVFRPQYNVERTYGTYCVQPTLKKRFVNYALKVIYASGEDVK